jgi:asparagine synthase (glutamine-hydrolysing)
LLAANVATYLPGDILVKVDRASMANGLEARSPLLDVHLLEYSASLAPWLLARGLSLKWIFKRAIAPWVPGFVTRRPKRGFGAPVGPWFRGPGGATPERRLLASDSPLAGAIDVDSVGRLLAAHRAGADEHGIMLWRLLVLDEWLRAMASPAPSLRTDQTIPSAERAS